MDDKFTGKERDAESGLDNFTARYDSSNLGRFMSPDPLGGNMTDPQTLNKYSYVRNNPLNLTDPTGMYICADSDKCDSKADQAFEKSRQDDLKRGGDVARAAGAYGDPTKDNGTTVKFGDPGNGKDGTTTGNGFRQDPNNPDHFQAVVTVTIKSGLGGAELDAAVGHEGSHVADRQDFASTITAAGGFDASKNLTEYQTETRAYGVTQSILASENTSIGYGTCGVGGSCKLGSGVNPANAAQTIAQLLANPANKYGTGPHYGITPANPGPILYPGLTTPQPPHQ